MTDQRSWEGGTDEGSKHRLGGGEQLWEEEFNKWFIQRAFQEETRKQGCRNTEWQRENRRERPGKAPCPEVSEGQSAGCTGLVGKELAWQAGQNEAKAQLQA